MPLVEVLRQLITRDLLLAHSIFLFAAILVAAAVTAVLAEGSVVVLEALGTSFYLGAVGHVV